MLKKKNEIVGKILYEKEYSKEKTMKKNEFLKTKSFLCVLVSLLIVTTMISVSCAETLVPVNIEERAIGLFTIVPVINVLRDRLLKPDSLELHEVGCIQLSEKYDQNSFVVIQYVAQNRMGGYTDDWIFALVTNNISSPEVAVMSLDYEIFSGDIYMKTLLKEIVDDYCIQPSIYKTHSGWHDMPTDIEFYDGLSSSSR